MDIGAVQPGGVVPGGLKIGGFEPDQRAEFGGMVDREIEHDTAADRTPHHHGLVQLQRAAERADRLRVAHGGELIFLAAPVRRRIGLAMPGHVEGDDAEVLRELFIRQQMPPLPPVGAGGVQAHQRDAGAVLLEIDAMHLAIDLDTDVAADHRLDGTVHDDTVAASSRGSASRSLKYCRCAMKGCRSPSSTASPRLVSASRSCQPGFGMACQYSAHAADVARYEKRQDRINTGACVRSVIRPARIDTWNGRPIGPSRQSQSRNRPRMTSAGVRSSNAGISANALITAASEASESGVMRFKAAVLQCRHWRRMMA